MIILYTLPFFIISLVICIVFDSWLKSLGDLAELIGIGLVVVSIILGNIVAIWRMK